MEVEAGIRPALATLPPSQLRRERVVPQSTAKRQRSHSDPAAAESEKKKSKTASLSPEERLKEPTSSTWPRPPPPQSSRKYEIFTSIVLELLALLRLLFV